MRAMFEIALMVLILATFSAAAIVFAGAPSGSDTFELTTSPTTGGDNTGDGGTGDGNDFNYFYVGQSFTTTIAIVTGGASSANIWIDYGTATVTASNVTNGTFFDTWSGQTINTSESGSFGGGRVLSTGFNVGGGSSSGLGSFGTVDWAADTPTNASYGTSTPGLFDINVGTIGDTTESNISLSGNDILDDEEDFQFHIWADTVAPYTESVNPATASTSVSVTSTYTFNLRDSKNGDGDNSGSGTGVNTSEPPGVITFNATSETDDSSFSCSGIWGTELCAVTVEPTAPSGISGDTRNFNYNTTYTVIVSGFTDLASTDQDDLGDANGPNTMTATTTTFTTETDSVKPQVTSETPARASSGNATTTNITVQVEDRKTYPSGASGTGIDSSTCQINVSSPSQTLITYNEDNSQVSTTSIDYGYQYVIDPTSNFAENETVTISVFACTDAASNVMTTDTYTFTTSDATAPFVDDESPANDASVATNGTITFHIEDTGGGVSLATTTIYVNGVYYTNSGGSGSVTTSGTSITFSSSLNFNGSNYVGDTTSVSGTSADYTFTIDPETDFTAGESVPVLIYSSDVDGNLMEREVIGIVAQVDGSTFCGSNTTWNGSLCIGSSVVVLPPGGGGGGGGGPPPSQTGVSFAGRAYPLNRVDLLKDGQIVASTIAGPDARFYIEVSNVNAGSHLFSVLGEDKNGLRSVPFSVPVVLTQGVTTHIGGLFLSPTLTVDKSVVKKGDNIAIFGQTAPLSSVTIGVASEHETFHITDADEDGVFLYNFDTTPLERGEHETRAKAAKDNEITEFGRTVAFEVGEENILNTEKECPLRGDLNSDCRVNLVDFSIAGFWYKKVLSESVAERELAVLSGDGIINLIDLSIMGFYWTG